jgi:rhamnosyltransferase
MVVQLLRGYEVAARQTTAVAAVGPCFVQNLSRTETSFVQLGWLHFKKRWCGAEPEELVPVDLLISSGALIAKKALDSVGLMREELFVDQVDTDWFLRARSRGWSIFGVCAAKMEHSLGDRTLRIWIGRWRDIPVHSPLRHYYAFRNGVFLSLRSGHPWRWKLATAQRLVGLLVVFTLLLPERSAHLKMMLAGACDGARGRLGAYGVTHNEAVG